MEVRRIEPAIENWKRLPRPPTVAEERFAKALNRALPLAWEMYLLPYLNGFRPSVVLLHPKVGAAIYMVLQTDLPTSDIAHRRASAKVQAFNRLRACASEVRDLFCPGLPESCLRLGIILADMIDDGGVSTVKDPAPFNLKEANLTLFDEPLLQLLEAADRQGKTNLAVRRLLPSAYENSRIEMDSSMAVMFRHWLGEPHESSEMRKPVRLNARQREIAQTRTATGFRRVRVT